MRTAPKLEHLESAEVRGEIMKQAVVDPSRIFA
jgi:hypothetical protein